MEPFGHLAQTLTTGKAKTAICTDQFMGMGQHVGVGSPLPVSGSDFLKAVQHGNIAGKSLSDCACGLTGAEEGAGIDAGSLKILGGEPLRGGLGLSLADLIQWVVCTTGQHLRDVACRAAMTNQKEPICSGLI